MEETIQNKKGSKNLYRFDKHRLKMIKNIHSFIGKNDLTNIKQQLKLQKKMEKYHQRISGKQKVQKETGKNKYKQINFTEKISFLFKFFLILVFLYILQIFILLKGSVFIYSNYSLNVWLSILFASLLVSFILTCYLSFYIWKKLRTINLKLIATLSLIPIILCSSFLLLYKSEGNMKTNEISSSFKQLHPLLKIAINLISIMDNKIIITDIAREKKFYKHIGLSENNESLHFIQKDGYVHAVDIRTLYRSEFRNWIVKWYFRILGFNVLRHVGTANHMHVSI